MAKQSKKTSAPRAVRVDAGELGGDEVYSIRLARKLLREADLLAERRGGVGRAAIVRMALQEYLDRSNKEIS